MEQGPRSSSKSSDSRSSLGSGGQSLGDGYQGFGWSLQDFAYCLRLKRRTILGIAGSFFILVALVTFLQPPKYRSTARLIVQQERLEEAKMIRGGVPALQRIFGLSEVANQVEFLKSRALAERLVDTKALQVRVDDPLFPSSVVSGLKSIPARTARWFSSRFSKVEQDIKLSRRDRYLRIRVIQAQVEPLDYKERRKYRLRVLEGGEFELVGRGLTEPVRGKFNQWLTVGETRLFLQGSQAIKPGDRFTVRIYSRERAVDDVARMVRVSRSSLDSNHIVVAFEHSNPVQAEEFLTSYLAGYEALNKEIKARDTRVALNYIRNEARSLEEKFIGAQTALNEFQQKEGVFNLSVEAEALVERLTELGGVRDSVDLYARQLSRALQSLKGGEDASLGTLLQFPATEEVQRSDILRRFSELIQEREAQLFIKKPEHPDVRAIDEQIDALRGQVISVLSADYSRTTKRLADIGGKIAALEKRILSFPKLESKLAQLMLDVNVNQEALALLKNREAEAEIVLGSIVSDAEILDTPSEAWRRESPDVFVNLFGGLVFGIFLGVLWVISATALSKKVILPSTLERIGIRYLGEGEVVWDERTGRWTVPEKYRAILHALRAVVEATENSKRIIGVTSDSASASQGVLARAFAYYLSSTGLKTLFIDADLSSASEGKGREGLSELLGGDSEQIHPKPEMEGANLWMLERGSSSVDPGTAFGGDEFRRLLNAFVETYDWVVVNLAPLALTSDSLLSAKAVGQVLVTAKRYVTPIRDLQMIVHLCGDHGISLLGGVLTFERRWIA